MKPDKAHYYYRDEAEACAGTLIAGTDLSCGAEPRAHLMETVERGLITEDIIDRAAIRNLTSLLRQGWFDDDKVSVDVTNMGAMAGKEIVELYVRKITTETLGSNKPIRQLKGFEKVALESGETKTVTIDVPLKEIIFWSNLHKKMMIEEGEYVVEVGRSSADLPVSEHSTIAGQWDASISNVYCDVTKYVYNPGEQGRMKVSATLKDATHLCMCENKPTFTSSDPSVAVVSADGVVTAVAPGVATITAYVTWEGVTKSRALAVAVRA